jgi:hypothetical protein
MDQVADRCSSELERLAARVTELERRLSALEIGETAVVPKVTPLAAPVAAATVQQTANKASTAVSLVAVVGRSLLGLAGAYLLRAAFESGVAPRLVIVAIALLFAWGWLILSVRAAERSEMAGALYGITSSLIIFPMLWENALRFKLLSPIVTAAVLVAWLFSALFLVRRPGSAMTLWVTTLFAAGSGLGLFVATRDPFPFTLALLVSAALTEYAVCRERKLQLRIAVEVVLDLVLCILAYLAARPGGFPVEYNLISIPVLLVLLMAPLLISASSIAYRTFLLHSQGGLWDTVQSCATFALAFWAVLHLSGSTGVRTFGLFGFLTAVACYLEGFLNTRIRTNSWSFRFYTMWAGTLFLISSYVVLPVSVVTLWLYLSAIVAAALALRRTCIILGIHGFAWLMVAESTSGLLAYAAHLLAGGYPRLAPHMVWAGVISSVVFALILFLPKIAGRAIALLRCFSVANAALLVGAFGVAGTIMAVNGGASANAPWLGVVRSVVICLVTLTLALVGSRRNRRELIWVAYLTIGLGTLKLLLEDLRQGSSVSFALSLLAFGILLAIIPKLMRTEGPKAELPPPD